MFDGCAIYMSPAQDRRICGLNLLGRVNRRGSVLSFSCHDMSVLEQRESVVLFCIRGERVGNPHECQPAMPSWEAPRIPHSVHGMKMKIRSNGVLFEMRARFNRIETCARFNRMGLKGRRIINGR